MLDDLISRFDRMKHPLAVLIIIGLVFRLVFAPLFTFNIDMGYWTEVIDVFQNGFGLYGTEGYYYTPIWGYYLGTISGFMQTIGMTDYGTYIQDLAHLANYDFKVNTFVTSIGFNFLVKLPLIIVDTVTAWLVYEFIIKRTQDRKKALLGFALWFFSALVITESTFHGTFDNLSVMFLIIAIMMMFDRNYFLAGVAFATASLTKFFPLFFVFFMIAYILKREGVDKEGAKKLGIAVCGAIVATVVIYLPNIIRGDFWQSLYFMAYRVGLTKETLASIGPVASAAIVLAVIGIIVLVLYLIGKYGPRFMEKMNSLEEAYRNKRCAVILLKIALAIILVVGIVLLYTIFTKPNTVETMSMKGVVLICIFSIFLELYLAFRLLMLKDINDEKKVITILFLTALAVILWPSAASYMLIMVPFLCIYAAMIDRKFVKPCMIFMVLVTLTEISAFLLSPTSLMFALTGSVAPMIPIYEFLAQPLVFGLSGVFIITAVAWVLAYVSLLYIIYLWYYNRYKEGTWWTS